MPNPNRPGDLDWALHEVERHLNQPGRMPTLGIDTRETVQTIALLSLAQSFRVISTLMTHDRLGGGG